MIVELKKICHCIGLSGEISIRKDFFGYWGVAKGVTDSLVTQVKRLTAGRYVNINIIMVGVDKWPTSPQFPHVYEGPGMIEIEGALRKMREIFAQVKLGVGRIEYYAIPSSDAPDHEIINDECEATDLTNDWTVSNNGLDVFIVLSIDFAKGISAVDGPCDKDAYFGGMSGSIVELQGKGATIGNGNHTGKVMAHEVGHYLGLNHVYDGRLVNKCLGISDDQAPPEGTSAFYNCLDTTNQPMHLRERLMFPKGSTNILLTSSEGSKMRPFCSEILTFWCDLS
jgi:hypothetical protein